MLYFIALFLDADYENNQLFWVDAKLRVIQRTDFSGQSHITIAHLDAVSSQSHIALNVFEVKFSNGLDIIALVSDVIVLLMGVL